MNRRENWAAVFSLAALLGGFCAQSAAAPQTRQHSSTHLGTLAGTVVGPDGAAVSGARVTVEESSGRHAHAKLTDSQGRFEFPLLLPGMYDARAHGNRVWSPWERYIRVRPGKRVEVKLRLPPAKPSAIKPTTQ